MCFLSHCGVSWGIQLASGCLRRGLEMGGISIIPWIEADQVKVATRDAIIGEYSRLVIRGCYNGKTR